MPSTLPKLRLVAALPAVLGFATAVAAPSSEGAAKPAASASTAATVKLCDTLCITTHGGEADKRRVRLVSALVQPDNGDVVLLYEVCNLGKEFLTYWWDKPNLGISAFDPLAGQYCAAYELSATRAEPVKARVRYPVNDYQDAPAYLQQKAKWPQNFGDLVTRVSKIFKGEEFHLPRASRNRVADVLVDVRVAQKGKDEMLHTVQWYEPLGGVTLKVAARDEKALRAVGEHLKSQREHGLEFYTGAELREKVVDKADHDMLKDVGMYEGGFIHLKPTKEDGEGKFVRRIFKLKLVSADIRIEPAMTMNSKGRVRLVFSYATSE